MFENARPKKIKLLFHAKRPQMADHPRTRCVKVYEVEEHGGDVIPAKFVPIDGEGKEHVNSSRGQDTIGAPCIKLAQIDGGSLTMFVKQDSGDEVAGDNEKDLHSGEGVIGKERRHHFDASEVSNTDQGDRYGTQTVERRDPFHCSSLAFSVGERRGYLKVSTYKEWGKSLTWGNPKTTRCVAPTGGDCAFEAGHNEPDAPLSLSTRTHSRRRCFSSSV